MDFSSFDFSLGIWCNRNQTKINGVTGNRGFFLLLTEKLYFEKPSNFVILYQKNIVLKILKALDKLIVILYTKENRNLLEFCIILCKNIFHKLRKNY